MIGKLSSRRRVDAHERHLVVGEPAERAVAALLAHPAAVAQLDRHAVRRERLHQPVELLQPVPARREAGRELHEVAPSLPASANGAVSSTSRLATVSSSSGVRRTRPRSVGLGLVAQVGRAASRARAAWRESRRCTFTSNTKPSGVCSTHLWTLVRSGIA